jgi:hypothetical protein
MFIKQILFGVLRYSEFLKIFTENLFHINKSSTERKDEVLFQIFTYITIFRLNELPLEDYKQLVNVNINKNRTTLKHFTSLKIV